LRRFKAGVAELVDVLDLGSSAIRRGGSSPFVRTKDQTVWKPFWVRTVLSLSKQEYHIKIMVKLTFQFYEYYQGKHR
jgi:hypothetical protein